MASQQRCEDRSSAKPVIRRGDAPSEATGAGNHHTNRVVRATLRPGSGRAGPRQAEEGRVPPTADGRKREDTVASPTASCYPLRESQTRSRRRGTATGPGVRPATSPTKGSATRTGSRRDVTREGRERLGDEDNGSAHARTSTNVEQQPITSAEVLTVCPGEPTKCPLCTACYSNSNSMRTHLRRTHGDFRKVSRGTGNSTGQQFSGTDNTVRQNSTQHQHQSRAKRRSVPSRLLSAREVQRGGTWNVRSLRGLGKAEQLAGEMERFRLSFLAVTETHLPGEGEVMLDESTGHCMLFSGRQDGSSREGVGLALSRCARNAMRHYQAVSSRVLAVELLTVAGPISVVVSYAPTDQSSVEEKDQFYSDLDYAMGSANGLVMVMGDFNAAISESVQGVVGPHGLSRQTNDNGERLVSFACANGMCITNTLFPHKHIHQATWYPPNSRASPSLKDYILVRRRLRPSVLDTRVYRGGDIDSDHRLVIVSLRLKLKRRANGKPGKCFDVELLKQAERRGEYLETIQQQFDNRKGHGNVEERWMEMKEAIVNAATQHLQRRRPVKKKWITADTLELIEEKHMAFQRWQEVRSDENRRKQYSKCRKRVRRAIKEDKEKWLNEMMKEMEEDMRRHKQGSFFKKMRSLTQSRVTPTSIILDENNRPLHKAEEKLARWQRHFSEVLNVQNDLEEGVVMALEDHSQSDTPEVSREEVVRAVNKLQNGKAAGGDKVVAELVKKGGETMVNWLLELIQEVWRTG